MARVLKPGGRLVLTDLFHLMPVPAEFRPMIDAALAVQQLTPLLTRDEYARVVQAAGFDVVEFVDISAHTKYTLPKMAEAIVRDQKRITSLFGSQADAIVGSLTSAANAPGFGYLVLVAERAT
jgi:hypothetical protein